MDSDESANYTGRGEVYRKFRSGYSEKVIDLLLAYTGLSPIKDTVADIGAGTGIFSKQLANRGYSVIAVEPNDDMRTNGREYTVDKDNIKWRNGCAENSGLENKSVDWVTMASSFHWTKPERSLPEFYRILKDGGYVTLLWNPLVKDGDVIQEKIESIIQRNVSGFSRDFRNGENSREILLSSGYFDNVVEIRREHKRDMPVKDYLNAWRAANHLRTTAEKVREGIFEDILKEMEKCLGEREIIEVPYLTKAWTARKK